MKKKLLFIVVCLLIVIGILIARRCLNNNKDFYFKFKDDVSFLVPVQIGTEKFLFVLDTGASRTFIDTKLAQKFSTPLKGKNNILKYHDALNSMTSDILIKPINLKIGNHNVIPNILISHDFTDIRKVMEENIQGIIGLDIIRRFIWSIDIKHHKITMSNNIKLQDGQHCTKLQDDGYFIYTETIYSKNNKSDSIIFQLDTGALSNQIELQLAKYLRANKNVVENTLNKENPNIGITMKNKVSINDAINYINNMYLPVNANNKENYLESIILSDTNVHKNAPNLLGQEFIEQFSKVIINPYEKTFCFIKNPQVKVLKTIRQIYTKHNNNNKIIIYDNNAKYLNKLGLKNKDEIISVNSKKYHVDDLGKVRHLLRYEHNLILELKRDNKLIKVKLD